MSSFARNDLAISFKLDDAKANGDLSNFYPLRQGVEADLLIRREASRRSGAVTGAG